MSVMSFYYDWISSSESRRRITASDRESKWKVARAKNNDWAQWS
jgi:hypothetical protein